LQSTTFNFILQEARICCRGRGNPVLFTSFAWGKLLKLYQQTEYFKLNSLNLSLDTSVYRVYTTLGMNTAIINIKTEISTKKQAQQVASKLGLSLSALINAYLKEVIKTKRVEFSLDETPSPYLIKVLRQARKNRKAGKGSPIFNTGEEAVKWLEEQGI